MLNIQVIIVFILSILRLKSTMIYSILKRYKLKEINTTVSRGSKVYRIKS